MGWGGYGAYSTGGAGGSNNYMPDFQPYDPGAPDPRLERMRNRARDFASQMTYNGPNGKVVTHYMDPFSGDIRQLIEENRAMQAEDQANAMAYKHGLDADAREQAAWLDWWGKHGPGRGPGIVG